MTGTRRALDSDQHWVRPPQDAVDRYVAAGYFTRDLLGDIAREHARTAPDSLAVVDDRSQLTYGELEAQVAALAAGLRRWGLPPGARALVHLPNCAEFVVVVLGLWRASLVPVMALPAHRQAELSSFVGQSDAALYVSADGAGEVDHRGVAAELARVRPGLRHLVVPGVGAGVRGAGRGRTDDTCLPGPDSSDLASVVEAGYGAAPVAADVRCEDLALLQLSGGSTAAPKLIPRTHRDYLYSVRASVPICGVTARSVYLCVLPCAHNFAMSSAGILGQLYAGGTIVMSPDPGARTAFRLIRRHGVTISGVVPPVALLWLAAARDADAATLGLGSLQTLQVGGARLSAEVAARVTSTLGCRLQQVFGMAEGLVNYTRFDDPDEVVVHTQGRPISPDDEVRVVDDGGNPVPDGTPGHLLTRGPYTIRSYYAAPEHDTRAFTDDGFYRTGDIVVRRPSGHLTVVGRAKDQINRGGEKVAPEEVENHLLAHPGVHEVGVVGEPDEFLGERVVAHVVVSATGAGRELRAGSTQEVGRVLRSHLRARSIAAYKMPDRYVVVDTLPRTGVGKTSNARLRPGGNRTST